VTRLGEFSPIGQLFNFTYFKKYVEKFRGLLFLWKESYALFFRINDLGYIHFGRFLIHSAGHHDLLKIFV
jgi:hypothetical protein